MQIKKYIVDNKGLLAPIALALVSSVINIAAIVYGYISLPEAVYSSLTVLGIMLYKDLARASIVCFAIAICTLMLAPGKDTAMNIIEALIYSSISAWMVFGVTKAHFIKKADNKELVAFFFGKREPIQISSLIKILLIVNIAAVIITNQRIVSETRGNIILATWVVLPLVILISTAFRFKEAIHIRLLYYVLAIANTGIFMNITLTFSQFTYEALDTLIGLVATAIVAAYYFRERKGVKNKTEGVAS